MKYKIHKQYKTKKNLHIHENKTFNTMLRRFRFLFTFLKLKLKLK
jgi:hypothetical protein